MPKQIRDRDTTWVLEGDDRNWTLAAEATIQVTDGIGISSDADNTDIRVHGRIRALEGMALENDGAQVLIGPTARIIGTQYDGLNFYAAVGWSLVSHGYIEGEKVGIRIGREGTVENFGEIEGNEIGVLGSTDEVAIKNAGRIHGGTYGIDTSSELTIVRNSGTGEIVGDIIALNTFDFGEHRIFNQGLIHGGDVAIRAKGTAEVTIVNNGKIIGDITLAGGDDWIDTRGGVVRGAINGGEGDDIYWISRSSTRIVDNGASFFDMVRSTATYRLTGGLDSLFLHGGKDIDGTGNAGGNIIHGNSGANTLSGGDGADRLTGDAGNDLLSGGSGDDVFVFEKAPGRDRIVDFADGADFIQTTYVMTEQQFETLKIRQAGDDVVIDFGKGHRLTLENFDKDDLSFSDFIGF